MKNITQKIEHIRNWAIKANILIFEGDRSNDKKDVDWDSDGENQLDSFLLFIEKLEPTFVILSSNEYTFDLEEEVNTKNAIENFHEELQKEAEELIDELRKHDKEVTSYSLGFIREGIYYGFFEIADWIHSISRLKELLKEGNIENSFGYKMEIRGEVIEFAKQLSENKLFQLAQNKAMREYAAYNFFNDHKNMEINNHSLTDIIDMAQGINKFKNLDVMI